MRERGVSRMGAAWGMLALALLACDREYESPYLPGSGNYAGDDWTRDDDGDGVADSVAKYSPDCGKGPRLCIEDAKVVSRIGSDYRVAFGDMILWQGTLGILPRITWTPEEASARGYRLYSSDTAKVKIRDGRMDAVGVGNAQVTAALNGDSRTWSYMVRVVGGEGKRVVGITAKDLTVIAGGMAVPEITWNPPDAAYQDYTLSVDAPTVGWAQGAAIKALYPGTARVTVETQDGGHKALFTLKVEETPHRVEALSIAADDMYLVVGDTAAPIIRWSPHNVTEKRYLLAPADTTVASADQDRDRIVAVAAGRTQVSVFSLDGGNKTAYFTLNVAASAVPAQGLRAADMNLTVGSSPAFPRLTWMPMDATNRKFTIVSDSPHVAGVDGNLIVPLSLGLAPMRAVAADGGYQAPFLVRVQPQDTTIHVDSVRALDISLTVGYERAPLLTWYPENVGNQEYSLASADPTIASINRGLVRGEKGGNTTVAVTAADGGKTTTFKVNVVSAHIPVQRLQGEDMDMVVGERESPALTWFPGNATDQGYSLSSDNPGVVRIVDSTAVEALAVGTARVIVRAQEGPSDTLQVTVNALAIPVTGIAVADIGHDVGDPDKDVAGLIQWSPPNATDKSFQLVSSSNTAAVSLVDNKLRAVASGTSQVVIESRDPGNRKDTFTVTVRQPVKGVIVGDTAVWPGSSDIDPSRLITWIPANAENKGFVLASLDTSVASIFGADRVRPRASGTAHIILRSVENTMLLDTFKVMVMVPVKSLSVRDTTVLAGMKGIVPASLVTWNPANATDKGWQLLWAGAPSSNVVDSVTWRFNAVGPGKVNLIYVSTQNPAARDTFAVTVIRPLDSLSAAPMTMKVGDPDAAPTLAWSPPDASDKGYVLTGGAAGIATVVGGKVHAAGLGTATFTVKSNDGGKLATFTVTVIQPVLSIAVANMNLVKGGADTEPAITWNPANASNKGFTLAGGNAAIAIVAGTKVHPVGGGTTTFTVTTADGGKTDTFTATVTVPVVGVSCEDMEMRTFDPDQAPVIIWNPADATNKGYTLTSSEPFTVQVVGGKLRASWRGDAIITVTSDDGQKKGTCTVSVQ